MLDGHYLNLPVMNEPGEIVGMVDVLKLTYATLEQVNTMSSGDSEGPAWNKFWLSLDNESESLMSGDGASHQLSTHRSIPTPEPHHRNPLDRIDSSVNPNDSASHHGHDSPTHSAFLESIPEDVPFPFKFKAPSGRVHRLQVTPSSGMAELISNVTAKLGSEVSAVGGEAMVVDGRLAASGYALSYLDNEGDTVSITTDQDLLDAITLARQSHREKVDLFIHDPEKPPMSVIADPTPVTTPQVVAPTPREQTRQIPNDEDHENRDESLAQSRPRKTTTQTSEKEQLIAGVPNELLLPGAIAGLAVVIVAVFSISRSSAR